MSSVHAELVNSYERAHFLRGPGLIRLLFSLLSNYAPAGAILEAGSGSGALFSFVEEEVGERITQLENDPEMVKINQYKHPNTPIVMGDLYQLPFRANSYSTILSLALIDQLEDLPKAMKEVWRVLRPGGYFIHVLDMMPSHNQLVEDCDQENLVVFPYCDDRGMIGCRLVRLVGDIDTQIPIHPLLMPHLLAGTLSIEYYRELTDEKASVLWELDKLGAQLGIKPTTFVDHFHRKAHKTLKDCGFEVIQCGVEEIDAPLLPLHDLLLEPDEMMYLELGMSGHVIPKEDNNPNNGRFGFHVIVAQKPSRG